MSSKLTPKEALENIKHLLIRVNDTTDKLFIMEGKEIKCLEVAINRLEELEKENRKLKKEKQSLSHLYGKNELILKIIKEKDVLPSLVIENNSVKDYNETYSDELYHLTETEFILLKEYFK